MRNPLRPGEHNRLTRLEAEVAELHESVEENRRLNERLSDLLDLTVELLLPEDRRNDERLNRILDRLDPGTDAR